MNKKQWHQSRRAAPFITHKVGRNKNLKRQKNLKKEDIFAAKRFYEKEYLQENTRDRDKKLQRLQHFEYLAKRSEGWSMDEIAFHFDSAVSSVQGAIKQAEARVERYLKLKR